MPQSYGTPLQNTRPNPYRLRQDLGYVPARAASSSGSDGGGTSGGGIIISGGTQPVITSSRVQVETITATTYTLTADDLYQVLLFTNASGCVVTVPDDMTGAWADALVEIQPVFGLVQLGAGKVSVVGAGGVTVNTLSIYHPRSYGQFALMQLIEYDADTWLIFGAQDPI